MGGQALGNESSRQSGAGLFKCLSSLNLSISQRQPAAAAAALSEERTENSRPAHLLPRSTMVSPLRLPCCRSTTRAQVPAGTSSVHDRPCQTSSVDWPLRDEASIPSFPLTTSAARLSPLANQGGWYTEVWSGVWTLHPIFAAGQAKILGNPPTTDIPNGREGRTHGATLPLDLPWTMSKIMHRSTCQSIASFLFRDISSAFLLSIVGRC